MGRRYSYLGPSELLRLADAATERACPRSPDDVLGWTATCGRTRRADGAVTATFVVDTKGQLWIADRRTEHVACAAGQHVLSAGEITFAVRSRHIEVIEVTNQSTGYCPEPESWPVVAQALDRIGIPHPDEFTSALVFRRCAACGSKNIVKDGCFECGVCGAELSRDWNFGPSM